MPKTKKAVEEKVEEKKEEKVVRFEDLDLSACVNIEKAKRAFSGVYGGSKAGSVELTLANQLRITNPSIKKEELIIEVYKGLLGLLDPAKAKVNRQNEKKEKSRKEAR